MQMFIGVVHECDAVAFSPYPDGSVGAGVALEVETFYSRNLPVFIEYGNLIAELSVGEYRECVFLDIPQTRAANKENTPWKRKKVVE